MSAPMQSPSKRRRRLAQWQVEIVGAAAAIAILQAIPFGLARADDSSTEPPLQKQQTIATPLAKQSLQSLSATLKRPLFAPSRRPPPPEPTPIVRADPPPPPAPPPSAPAVTLIGTIIDALGQQAILRLASGEKDRRVRAGDDVGGWKVKDIEKSQLVLAQRDRTVVVVLFPESPRTEKQTIKTSKGR
jgi:hypothetical protein